MGYFDWVAVSLHIIKAILLKLWLIAGNWTLLLLLIHVQKIGTAPFINFHYACNKLVETTIYQHVNTSVPPKVGTGASTFWGANYQWTRVSAVLIKAGCQKRNAFYQFCWGYNLYNQDARAACKEISSVR